MTGTFLYASPTIFQTTGVRQMILSVLVRYRSRIELKGRPRTVGRPASAPWPRLREDILVVQSRAHGGDIGRGSLSGNGDRSVGSRPSVVE